MFDGLDMSKMGQMMEDIQKQAKDMEEQNKQIEVTAKGGGGMVEVTANGSGEVIDISIDESLMDDKESLQILLIATVNDANKMVEDNKKFQAMGMFGNMGMFGK